MNEVLAYVQRRINSFQRAPATWGSSETQETVMLTLCEIRAHIIRPIALKSNPYEVREFWCRSISGVVGKATNWTLTAILQDQGMTHRLPNYLNEFAKKYLEEFPPE